MKLATIILAAGMGTRMKSQLAKVLHPIMGRPLIDYPVELALAMKCERTIAVVGHQAEQVRAHLAATFDDQVETVLQSEQLGTGHAVLMAEKALKNFDGYVIILSGDVPLLTRKTVSALVNKVRRQKTVLGLVSAHLGDPTGYGRILRDDAGRICGVVEHRDADAAERAIDEANMGIYVADARFLFSMLKRIGTDNDQGEYYLPDLVKLAVAAGHSVAGVQAGEQESSGINNRRQLMDLEKSLRREICYRHMMKGVTIEDAETVWIDARAKIGADTQIQSNCRLEGAVSVGRGCRIEAGSILVESRLGDRVRVQPYTIIEHSRVKAGAILGPFAHLRPGSEIGEECHVGNFVETKKTTLKPGAKANHLSYLGDAVIGRRTNIGAGTITCNYDGYDKFRTVVGNDVLVGSDTQLIAPVIVPDRVVLGAGCSLTGRVPLSPGALVVMRPDVVVKPGYRDELEKRKGIEKTSKTGSSKTAKKK